MASNNFTITSAVSMGDLATIVGSVNGTSVTIQTRLRDLEQLQSSGGLAAVQNFIAGFMLAAILPAPQPLAIPGLIGSFSA
jgi:hypothetical protein